MSFDYLVSARRTLDAEVQALQKLTGDLINNSPGLRADFKHTGTRHRHRHGQSGHIGNKIAATFASTGTPAFFVHPGEVSVRRHGNDHVRRRGNCLIKLGIIRRGGCHFTAYCAHGRDFDRCQLESRQPTGASQPHICSWLQSVKPAR